MPRGPTEERAYVSFHFLEKGHRDDDGSFVIDGFSEDEFDALRTSVMRQSLPDISDAEQFEAVKYGRLVPFHDLEKLKKRMLRGRFEASYHGHAYKNSEKGKISADSINQRMFHFLLYLSKSGRIYIGTQYLGQYGDYGGLARTVRRFLGLGGKVRESIVRSDQEDYKGLVPKEIRVTVAKRGDDITSKGVFGSQSMIAFKPGDDTAEQKKSFFELLSLRGRPESEIKKKLAALVNESDAYSLSADDVQNCVITARKSKGRRDETVYLFGGGSRATKFELNVKFDSDGLPEFDKTQAEMIIRLKNDVVSILENV